MTRAGEPRPTVNAIIAATAAFYGDAPQDLLSQTRRQPLVFHRHAAMTLCYRLTGRSFPEIGRLFRCTNHTSAIYALTATERREAADPRLVAELAEIGRLAAEIAGYEDALRAAHMIGSFLRRLGGRPRAPQRPIEVGGVWRRERELAAAASIGTFAQALGPLPEPVDLHDELSIRAAWKRQIAAARHDPNLSHLQIG